MLRMPLQRLHAQVSSMETNPHQYQRDDMMKTLKIGIMLAVGIILMVMTTGNAFAYTWNGCDWSIQYSSSTSWYQNCYGTPSVAGGASLTWQNTFENEDSGHLYYPYITWYVDNNQNTQGGDYLPTYMSYRGTWCPTGSTTAPTTSGSHAVEVYHRYTTDRSQLGSVISTSHGFTV